MLLAVLMFVAALVLLALVLFDAHAARRERQRSLGHVSLRAVRNVCNRLEAERRSHPERQS